LENIQIERGGWQMQQALVVMDNRYREELFKLNSWIRHL
jgi:hypothetical protein